MKFQEVETDEYTPVGEPFEAGDMTEAFDIVAKEHGFTVQEVMPEEDTNNHIEILQHDISYYLDDDSEIELGDSESEHIEYKIGQGYSEGELCKTNKDALLGDNDPDIRGYWKMTDPKL